MLTYWPEAHNEFRHRRKLLVFDDYVVYNRDEAPCDVEKVEGNEPGLYLFYVMLTPIVFASDVFKEEVTGNNKENIKAAWNKTGYGVPMLERFNVLSGYSGS